MTQGRSTRARGPSTRAWPLASSGGNNYLYATNFHSGNVDVFDTNFAPHTFSAEPVHRPPPPARVRPLRDPEHQRQPVRDLRQAGRRQARRRRGRGLGFVDDFDTSGHLIERVATRGPLNSPWGLAVAPSSFGQFSGDLLVGNFGDGRINAFKPARTTAGSGSDGQLTRRPESSDHDRRPVGAGGRNNGGMNGGQAGPTTTLFFTAGINGEQDGLFGTLTATTSMNEARPASPRRGPGGVGFRTFSLGRTSGRHRLSLIPHRSGLRRRSSVPTNIDRNHHDHPS